MNPLLTASLLMFEHLGLASKVHFQFSVLLNNVITCTSPAVVCAVHLGLRA